MKPLARSLRCCRSFLAACVSSATTAQSSPGSGLIVVFVDEEYGEEDELATVAIGLVLGCLLVVVRDHHPILVVRSGVARTLPARQQEKAKQCHPVDGGGGGRGKGRFDVVEEKGAAGNRTLPTAMSVRNLGQSPRVLGSQAIVDGGRNRLPSRRGTRESLPTPSSVMSLLSMAVVPEERRAFRRRFRRAKKASAPGECGLVGEFLGGRTPIRVVATAFGWEPFRLRSIADMFPESGMQSNFLNEFYVMDVIANRRSAPLTAASGGGHAVCHAQSYIPDDGAPDGDYQFRAVILFLPQCGVFYCSRDRHAGDAGLQGTLRAYDMSWLRLVRTESEHCLPSYTFGDDSYVQRFYSDTTLPCGTHQVSAWRLSTGRVLPGQQVVILFEPGVIFNIVFQITMLPLYYCIPCKGPFHFPSDEEKVMPIPP